MLWCYDCGYAVPVDVISCPACGGGDITDGPTRPEVEIQREADAFPWPWELLSFPPGFALVLNGGPGLGKTSLAALLRPQHWLTNEMQPAEVGAFMRRIAPGARVPMVHITHDPDEVAGALLAAGRGDLLVIDSVTGLGLEGGPVALRAMRGWAQRNAGRVVAINQVAKDDRGAGRMRLAHDPDVVAYVRGDVAGRRRLDVTKNRGGRLFSAVYTFDKRGQLALPSFKGAYSVEGDPGSYRLAPVPTDGAKWDQLYRHLPEDVAIESTASCARRFDRYKSGWLEPEDLDERRAFAEAHGLRWISPGDH